MASYAPVPGTPWGYVIEADWTALMQPSRGYRQFLLLLLALGLVIPTTVVYFGSRHITQPIRDLISAAQQVASGNFGQIVTAHTGDEVEELVVQFNLRHKDGSYRWILARAIALRDPQGSPYRMAGLHTDITELKRTQAILAGQRRFLELMAQGESFGRILDALVGVIEEQSPGMRALVHLLGQDDKSLYCASAPSLPGEFVAAMEAHSKDTKHGFCNVMSTGQRAISQDIASDPRWEGPSGASAHGQGLRDIALRHGLRACWAEPIASSDGRAIGIFAMYSAEPRDPTAGELRTIETAARLVGVSLEHEQTQQAIRKAYQSLERRVDERTRELATLNELAAVVSRSLDLKEILSAALDKTMEAMGMDLGIAYRLDTSKGPLPEQQTLAMVAQRGLSEEMAQSTSPVPLQRSHIAVAAADERPIAWHTADAHNDDARAFFRAEGLRMAVSVPLMVKERLVGGIVLITRDERPIRPDERSLLGSIGREVGVAIEHAQLYEAEQQRHQEAERRREVAEGLRETITVLNSRQSLGETLDHIVAQASRLLESDAVALLRLEQDAGSLAVQAAHGFDADDIQRLRIRWGTGVVGSALAQRKPIAIDDVAALNDAWRGLGIAPVHPETAPGQQFTRQIRALIAVPLVVRDEDYGAIVLYYAEHAEKIPLHVQGEIYHIIQEALNNVLKHAHAKKVCVDLSFCPDGPVRAQVRDDGIGFELAQAQESGGLGMRNMLERARRIGATLRIESEPGKGTRMLLDLDPA